jgi:hypothetical protein
VSISSLCFFDISERASLSRSRSSRFVRFLEFGSGSFEIAIETHCVMRATSQHLNEHLGVLMSNLYGPSTAIRSVVEKGGRWKCVQYHRRVPHAISIYKFAWRYCRGVGPKGVRPRHERITYHITTSTFIASTQQLSTQRWPEKLHPLCLITTSGDPGRREHRSRHCQCLIRDFPARLDPKDRASASALYPRSHLLRPRKLMRLSLRSPISESIG